MEVWVITFIVGQLLKISWKTSFLVYLIVLPIIINFIIFVPNITQEYINKLKLENTKALVKENEDYNKVSNISILGYIVLLFIVVNFYMSVSVKGNYINNYNWIW